MRTTKNLKTGYEVYFLIAAIDLRMKNKYKQTVNVMYDIFHPLEYLLSH